MMSSSRKRLPKLKGAVLPRTARFSMLEDELNGEKQLRGARKSVLSSSTNVSQSRRLQPNSSRHQRQPTSGARTSLKHSPEKTSPTKSASASRSARVRKARSSPPKTLLVSKRRESRRGGDPSSHRASSLAGQDSDDEEEEGEEEDAETTREENVSLLRSLSGCESAPGGAADDSSSSASRSTCSDSPSRDSASCKQRRSPGDEKSVSDHESDDGSDSDGGRDASRYDLADKFDAASKPKPGKMKMADSSVRKRMELLKLEAVFGTKSKDATSSDEQDDESEESGESSGDSSDEYTYSDESDEASGDSEVSFEEDEMAINLASKAAPQKKNATKSKPPPITEKFVPKRNSRVSYASGAETPTPPFPRATSKRANSKSSNKAAAGAAKPCIGMGNRAASSLDGRGTSRTRQPLQPKSIAVRSARRATNRPTIARRKALPKHLERDCSASGDSLSHSGASSVSDAPGGWPDEQTDEHSFRDSDERGERAPISDALSSTHTSENEVSIEKFDGSDTDDDESVVEAEVVVDDDPLHNSILDTEVTALVTKANGEDMSLDATPLCEEKAQERAEGSDTMASPMRDNNVEPDSLDRSAPVSVSSLGEEVRYEDHAVLKSRTVETCELLHSTSADQKSSSRRMDEPTLCVTSECTVSGLDCLRSGKAINRDSSPVVVPENDHVGLFESDIASRVASTITASPEPYARHDCEVVPPVADTVPPPASPSDTSKVNDQDILVDNLPPRSEGKSVRWTHGVSNEPIRNEAKRRQRLSVKRGQWLIGQKIGSGAFGVVHIGLKKSNGTFMAVKQITLQTAVMVDIRREVDLLKSLHHENIVQYFGAEVDDTTLYIFQEWVAGGSITRMLSKFGAFPAAVVRSYSSQALFGLAYLHENGVMHRDIKGSNILVSHDGVCKLCDFGGSKRLESEKMQKHTMRGSKSFFSYWNIHENTPTLTNRSLPLPQHLTSAHRKYSKSAIASRRIYGALAVSSFRWQPVHPRGRILASQIRLHSTIM